MPHSDPPPELQPTIRNLSAQVSGMIAHVELAKKTADAALRMREPLTRRDRLAALFLGAFLGSALAILIVSMLVALGVVLGRG